MNAIIDAHTATNGSYGHRQIHAGLVLGCRLAVSHGRVERLMRCAPRGVHRRRRYGCTVRPDRGTSIPQPLGGTFMLKRNVFNGSYCSLTALRRARTGLV